MSQKTLQFLAVFPWAGDRVGHRSAVSTNTNSTTNPPSESCHSCPLLPKGIWQKSQDEAATSGLPLPTLQSPDLTLFPNPPTVLPTEVWSANSLRTGSTSLHSPGTAASGDRSDTSHFSNQSGGFAVQALEGFLSSCPAIQSSSEPSWPAVPGPWQQQPQWHLQRWLGSPAHARHQCWPPHTTWPLNCQIFSALKALICVLAKPVQLLPSSSSVGDT